MSISLLNFVPPHCAHLWPQERIASGCGVYQASAPCCATKSSTTWRLTRGSFSGLLQLVAQEHGDRHAPDALPRDAPVGTRGDHVGDALLAPGRVPLHFLDFVERAAAQGFAVVVIFQRRLHGDEPLLGGAKDDGIVAAPAMRIGVLDLFGMQQHAARLQQLDDRSDSP